MDIRSLVASDVLLDESSVWVLKNHRKFGYSDGVESEKYLDSVLRNAKDLSTRSSELEGNSKDWPSEYHLTRKRAQLLAGFDFDRSLKVLEVGCGCGAITRHLGESFDTVVSIEGSINRAHLARQRTRDLESVSIICAPFQEIKFSQKFDIIFCIGVYEYSASFVDGSDPYDAVLRYFSDILTPNGMVIVAIENQFGLKYFASSREDHLGVMFEGIEGYHAQSNKVRTFGKVELENNLSKYFQTIQFYYPYPDYKLPDCVLTGDFLRAGYASELVSQMRSRDYMGDQPPLWDEASVLLELGRNAMLDFFSNSFLVVAGKGQITRIKFDQLAVIFSSGRKEPFSTVTKITKGADNRLIVSKRARKNPSIENKNILKLVDTDSEWNNSQSLQTLLYLRSKTKAHTLESIFEPCRAWVDFLRESSTGNGDIRYLSGDHIDSIWPNFYPASKEQQLIDREWVWHENLALNVVVIRAIYNFLCKMESSRALTTKLNSSSGKTLIKSIAQVIGVELSEKDFDDFVHIESTLQSIVFGLNIKRHTAYLRWFLMNRPTLNKFRKATRLASRVRRGVEARVARLF